jgi:hypothetical protein
MNEGMVMVKPKAIPKKKQIPQKPQKPQEKQTPQQLQSKQKPESRVTTRQRVQAQEAQCAICKAYVAARESLVPVENFPPVLRNHARVIEICQQCYQDCMAKCVDVMGKSNAVNCRTIVCDDKSKAYQYAQIDQQRAQLKTRGKLNALAALRAQAGWDTKYWPSVPKTEPK